MSDNIVVGYGGGFDRYPMLGDVYEIRSEDNAKVMVIVTHVGELVNNSIELTVEGYKC